MAGRPQGRTVVVRAHAKINLTLRVLGRRRDGYHELQTIFQSIALHDTLTVRAARGPFRLECDDPSCPTDESNLVWRAAAALADAVKRRGATDGVAVRLKKRIPMEAGLGGGSSDAAAMLIALGRLWRVRFDRLRDVAASIGADVPYFLVGGTALGLNRGDMILPLPDVAPAWATIAVPPFGVSTRDAFAAWDRLARGPSSRARRHDSLNDLQRVVEKQHPAIGRLVAALQRAGARHAAMSGSGSAVFGLYDRRTDAAAATAALSKVSIGRGSRVRGLTTRTIARAVYRRLSGIDAG